MKRTETKRQEEENEKKKINKKKNKLGKRGQRDEG
jgi:hypothetical protein